MLTQNRPAVSFILTPVFRLLTPKLISQFSIFNSQLRRRRPSPDSLSSRFRRIFIFNQADCAHLPLVCRGKLEPDHFHLKT